MWSNVREQLGGLSLLRLLVPPTQFPYNIPPLQDGDMRQLVSHPAYCHRKNLIPGFNCFIRCHWLMLEDGSLFSQVVSRSWLAFFLRFGVLRAAACGNWKICFAIVIRFHLKDQVGTASLMRPIWPLLVSLPNLDVDSSCSPDDFKMQTASCIDLQHSIACTSL